MWEAAIEPREDALDRLDDDRLETTFDNPAKLLQSFLCTAEHIVARSDGGSDDPENIVAACMLCNSSRMSMPVEEFRQLVRKNSFVMEAGHDRSVVDGQWHDKVAYDFRWKVAMFIEERAIWIELFCQEFLPYEKFFKNHWHLRASWATVYPAFNGNTDADHLAACYERREEIEGSRLLLENVEHEPVIRKQYCSKIAA